MVPTSYIPPEEMEPSVKPAYQILFEYFKGGVKVGEGIASTVNLSGHTALVETSAEIGPDAQVILWILAPFYTLMVQATVAYSKTMPGGRFHTGLTLTNVIEGSWEIVQKTVQSH